MGKPRAVILLVVLSLMIACWVGAVAVFSAPSESPTPSQPIVAPGESAPKTSATPSYPKVTPGQSITTLA